MRIASAASAFPKNQYDQYVLLSALKRHWGPKMENPQFIERLHSRVGVDTRNLALTIEEYEALTSWKQANDHWISIATDLGSEALAAACARGGIDPKQLGAIYFVSVTGIASPSVDAKIINRLSLSPQIKRVPVFGLGCVAGAAGLARAADYVRGFPDQVAAVVSVELCSLTLQQEDLSVANLISSGLFGDGAAAVLVAGADVGGIDGPQVLATRSVFYPESEHVMGWDISDKGFRIVLSREVPEVVDQHLAGDVDAFLASEGKTRADIGSWILHTGGPRILEATARALQLPPGALDTSWECLRRTGNLSSASVLCVLEEFLMNKRPSPGIYSLLAAMGPGFCSELVLLRW
ncbi:MAG TPA: 3-oxoacyl-[acyl-carrier-protein] synthase III C-terminal domain-containing protein [Bryobacteraceae bacterium]|jgi:alkylresorcinol/alkylpyrone synthase